jgi:hypothetical protein
MKLCFSVLNRPVVRISFLQRSAFSYMAIKESWDRIGPRACFHFDDLLRRITEPITPSKCFILQASAAESEIRLRAARQILRFAVEHRERRQAAWAGDDPSYPRRRFVCLL